MNSWEPVHRYLSYVYIPNNGLRIPTPLTWGGTNFRCLNHRPFPGVWTALGIFCIHGECSYECSVTAWPEEGSRCPVATWPTGNRGDTVADVVRGGVADALRPDLSPQTAAKSHNLMASGWPRLKYGGVHMAVVQWILSTSLIACQFSPKTANRHSSMRVIPEVFLWFGIGSLFRGVGVQDMTIVKWSIVCAL